MEYNELLAKEQGNLTHLLDKVTYDCEEYFKFVGVLGGEENVDCSTMFRPHHYGLGGKCFPNIGFTNLSMLDLNFELTYYPEGMHLNPKIANQYALQYGTYAIYIMNYEDNLYGYDYDDLTPVGVSALTTLKLKKKTGDHKNQHRYTDAPSCRDNLTYNYRECSRYTWLNKLKIDIQ